MKQRPLAPHLQIYRPQLTSITSILHRLSGIILALGLPILVLWFVALSGGEESFAKAQSFAGSILGRTALFGWTLSLFYHLLNGLRHLGWDAGWGLDIKRAYRTGYAVFIGTLFLSLLSWIFAYWLRGQG